MKKEFQENIGQLCKSYRLRYIKMSLKDFAKFYNDSDKNIWAFENGKANNLKYLFYYYKLLDDSKRISFSKELFNIL